MNHTKGKWKVMEHNTIVSWLDGDYIGQIAEVYDPAEVIGKQEEQANAERIVKAVNSFDDMYEALKALRTKFKVALEMAGREQDLSDLIRRELTETDKALDKAEVA